MKEKAFEVYYMAFLEYIKSVDSDPDLPRRCMAALGASSAGAPLVLMAVGYISGLRKGLSSPAGLLQEIEQ